MAMRRWRHRPGFFLWRAAGFFLFVVLAGGAACVGTLWMLGLLGERGAPARPLAWAAMLLAALLLLTLLAGVRRLALPLGDLIEAAGRVEAGDYSVRVNTRGPRELRLLGRAFNDMAERLERNEAQRRDLLADVTHELRTPVAVIQGNLEGVLDGIYPADSDHLGPVVEEVRQLSHLIDDLRTLSLSESGALELHREPTDLAVLAGEVAASFRAQAGALGVELSVEAPEELPLAEVDPIRIREVLVNLVANSLRHTSGGGRVTVGARLEPDMRRFKLTVEDNGAGIPAEQLPHIFDRFYKSQGSSGSGLGLTIARHLVQAHGGEIGAESAPGRGTTLRFTLPLAPAGQGAGQNITEPGTP
jgi:signal transduction histidine kinase